MIRATRPSDDVIDDWLGALDRAPGSPAPFSYAEIRATTRPDALVALAPRYAVDRRRFRMGTGRPCFARACDALFAWRHFEIPWLELRGALAPVHEGQVVATLTRVVGVCFLNPCRVVYREDPDAASNEAAFAYGTLAGHVAAGEERFSVRHDPGTDEVVFEILAFSRPAVLLTRLGRPWMRRVQRRFAGDAAAALARACGGAASERI